MSDQCYYIFDFDSTIVQAEALEELARVSLIAHPKREKIFKEIARITDLGMEGKLPFHESLEQRIALLGAKKEHIQALIARLQEMISPSVLENEAFFQASEGAVYVVSGGFKEFIVPVVALLGIPAFRVFANEFVYDKSGRIVGVDTKNPLSREGGKVEVVKNLKLQGTVIMVGDGMSDVQVKEAGLVDRFIAYTETVHRAPVVAKADAVAKNFDELLALLLD